MIINTVSPHTHTHTHTHKQTSLKNNGLLNTAAHDNSTIYSRHWIKDYANSEFNSAADINRYPLSQIHLEKHSSRISASQYHILGEDSRHVHHTKFKDTVSQKVGKLHP